eukprot:556441-Amphidinium_carterae.1
MHACLVLRLAVLTCYRFAWKPDWRGLNGLFATICRPSSIDRMPVAAGPGFPSPLTLSRGSFTSSHNVMLPSCHSNPQPPQQGRSPAYHVKPWECSQEVLKVFM